MVHELKISPENIRAILFDDKKFEVRYNDRNYQVGDILILREWFSDIKKYGQYEIKRLVTYILDDPQYCKEGYVIMGIRRLDIAREDIWIK